MGKYKESKQRTGILGVSIAFIVVATILIIIGYKNQVLDWMKTTGFVLLVLSLPVLSYFLHEIFIKKIKEM